jgi:PAS domain S-box-containing protein
MIGSIHSSRLPMKRYPIFTLAIIVTILCGFTKPATAKASHPEVLILNAYHQGEDWSDNQLDGILTSLKKNYPFLVPSIEHLDTKRFPGFNHLLFIKQYLKNKYQGRQFDLIITLDNSALDLMLQFGNELFPDVPIVFAGVNGYRPEMLGGHQNITGVAEVQDMAGTLNLALKLHPDTKTVLAVHDYTSSGLAVHRDMESAAKKFKGRVNIKYTPEGTVDDLVAQLEALPQDAIVMLLTYVTDKNGRTLTREESTRLITSSSPVPVYAMHETRLGYGIVGGMLLEGREHGSQATALALRILAGENISQIPVENSGSRPVLDYQALARFKVPEKGWPANAVIINRPFSFWQRNRALLMPGLAIIGVLAILTAFLSSMIIRMRRAEVGLRDSETKYRILFEQMTQGAFRQRADGSLIDVNPAALRMFGLTRDEFLGRTSETPAWDVVREDGSPIPGPEHPSMVALNTGKPVSGVIAGVLQKKTQERVWMEINAIPEFQPGENNPYQVMVTMHDLSDYKQAQAELKESEDKFRSFAEQSLVGIYLISGDVFKYVNPKFAEMFGYSVDECLDNMHFPELVHPEDLPTVEKQVGKRLSGETKTVRYSFRGIKKSGETIHVEIFGSYMVLKSKTIATGTMLDITERKRAEEVLKESESFFSQMFEQSTTSTCLYNPDGTINRVNKEFCKMFGVEEDVIMNAGYNVFEDQAAIDAGVIPLLRVIFDEKKTNTWETIFDIDVASASTGTPTSRDGKIFLEVFGYPVLNRNGTLEYVVLQHYDITERKRADEELLESEEYHRGLFENSPTALYLQDFTGVEERVKGLKSAGISDLGSYLRANPEEAFQLSRAVVFSSVNQAAVDLYKAGSKSNLLGSLDKVIIPGDFQHFIDQVVAFTNGEDSWAGEARNYNFQKEIITILIK